MALSGRLSKELNRQTNAEFYSSYLYLSMAAYLTDANMPGCAHWMRIQAQEELLHAIKIQDFILGRQSAVKLETIKEPPHKWTSVVKAFEDAYAHEKEITKKIHDLLDVAIKETDHATANLLRWFVDEQVEEESTLIDLLHKFKLIGDSGSGLFILDRELASRTAASATSSKEE